MQWQTRYRTTYINFVDLMRVVIVSVYIMSLYSSIKKLCIVLVLSLLCIDWHEPTYSRKSARLVTGQRRRAMETRETCI